MPPVQPSFRGSLLTGASALALSVPASGAYAQAIQTPPATWTVWGEGLPFWTGGGAFNIPSLPGLGAPFTSLSPKSGFEFAVGADYHPQGQPWHYIFDFRYGRTGTTTSNSSSSSSSSSTSFTPGIPPFFGSIPLGTTTNSTTSTSSATQASQWESHLVADLMIGRDLGVGTNKPELQFGLRVADLRAAAQALQTGQSTTIANSLTTFYSSSLPFPGTGSRSSSLSSSSTSSFFARWNSRFFGVGPRLAVTGGVPIQGSWSFDYSGGVAALIGDRSFNIAMWTMGSPAFSANYNTTVFVFNADGFAALSYKFTPNLKASLGIRADYYNSALKTYDISTGGLSSLDRVYWGPFVRLTGSFGP